MALHKSVAKAPGLLNTPKETILIKHANNNNEFNTISNMYVVSDSIYISGSYSYAKLPIEQRITKFMNQI